jgi:serine protease
MLVAQFSGGGISFEQKTLHCQQSGGVAAIVYNNRAGYIGGGLSNATATTIPAIQMNARDGKALLQSALGLQVSIEVTKGYGYLSGTSMAVPHVTGVIAKIWRAVRLSFLLLDMRILHSANPVVFLFPFQCPQCTNVQVESCLLSTAIDLGDEGKDVLYGHGLVQAEDAYFCLVATEQCCDEEIAESDGSFAAPPPPSPSAAPAVVPAPSKAAWTSPPVQWMGSGDNYVAMSTTVGE